MKSGPKPLPPESRFWRRVEKIENGCWLYGGRFFGNRYGQLQVAGRGSGNVTAHRFSFELHHGLVPVGMFVCHKCDVRNCVNPEHLYVGTHEDNTRDIIERGRTAKNTGRCRPLDRMDVRFGHNRALAKEQREQLKAEYASGAYTQMQLADRYRISQATVSATIRGVRNMGSGEHKPRRSGNFRRKLTAKQYVQIRELYRAGSTQQKLAVAFGCDQTTISRIVLGDRPCAHF